MKAKKPKIVRAVVLHNRKVKRKPAFGPPRQKLGRYFMGLQAVDLFVDRDDTGGHIKIWPEKTQVAALVVGLNQTKWRHVLNTLIHEVMEMTFVQVTGRFSPDPDFAYSHGGYLFVVSHLVFEDAVSRAAAFLDPAIPALRKAFDRMRRSQRTNERLSGTGL